MTGTRHPSAAAMRARPGMEAVPALDGMRAAAVLLVLAAHLGVPGIPGGFGVTFFFFISGLLITRLLLAEGKGRINLPGFYLRRGLRLGPALVFFVATTSVISLQWGRPPMIELAAALLFFQNYFDVLVHLSEHVTHLPYWPLWSVAVEAHFYLFYPVLMVLYGRHYGRLMATTAALCLAILLWRLALFLGSGLPEAYFEIATDTRFDSLLFGCLASLLLFLRPERMAVLAERRVLPLLGLGLLFASLAVRHPIVRDVLRYTMQGLGLLLVLVPVLVSSWAGPLRRLLSWPPIRWVGGLSYSLYLWNWAVISYSPAGPLSSDAVQALPLGQRLLRMGVVFVLAAVSYQGVERPATRLRRHFGSRGYLPG